jgi:hypothetical protein
VPFGFDFLNHQLVMNEAEQATIRAMQEQRAAGLSLRQIIGALNQAFIPTKQGGLWQDTPCVGYLPACDSVHAELFAGDLHRDFIGADCVPTRPNVRVGALLSYTGQRHAARMPRVSGPWGGWEDSIQERSAMTSV